MPDPKDDPKVAEITTLAGDRVGVTAALRTVGLMVYGTTVVRAPDGSQVTIVPMEPREAREVAKNLLAGADLAEGVKTCGLCGAQWKEGVVSVGIPRICPHDFA